MLIIEIESLENGAHRNQKSDISEVPNGWIIVPPEMEDEATGYLPFINLTIENNQLISVSQGDIPEPEPIPESKPTAQEDIDSMLVDHEYRLTLLELFGNTTTA